MEDRLALQWAFAQHVQRVTDWPLRKVLFKYSQYWYWFKIGRPFSEHNPIWGEYMAGLVQTADPLAYSRRFYEARQAVSVTLPGADNVRFGCFNYAVWGNGRIRLHFTPPPQATDHSILGHAQRPLRIAELKALCQHIQRHVRKPQTIAGGSWLYNIEAYRRLFPPDYLATARKVSGQWQYNALWGQFYDRNGRVRPEIAHPFLERARQQTRLADLLNSFPYQVLEPECDFQQFWAYYEQN